MVVAEVEGLSTKGRKDVRTGEVMAVVEEEVQMTCRRMRAGVEDGLEDVVGCPVEGAHKEDGNTVDACVLADVDVVNLHIDVDKCLAHDE